MRNKIADIIRNNQNGDTDWDEMLDQLCDLYGVVSSSDKIVIEVSDEEIMIVTRQDLEQMKKDAMEFDGFEGWIVRGKLV